MWKYEKTFSGEPIEPDVWRVYDERDPSHEATICELWSGEHDNEAMAREICDLHNEATRPRQAHSCDTPGCAVCDPCHGL